MKGRGSPAKGHIAAIGCPHALQETVGRCQMLLHIPMQQSRYEARVKTYHRKVKPQKPHQYQNLRHAKST
jgi:hypothetical protein